MPNVDQPTAVEPAAAPSPPRGELRGFRYQPGGNIPILIPPSERVVIATADGGAFVGIRANHDDDNGNQIPDSAESSRIFGENDLIRLEADITSRAIGRTEYQVRSGGNLRLWRNPDKTEPFAAFPINTWIEAPLGSSATLWAEWIGPASGEEILEVVARSDGGTEGRIGRLRIRPFTSHVVLVSGETAAGGGIFEADPIPHGTTTIARNLVSAGLDVSYYTPAMFQSTTNQAAVLNDLDTLVQGNRESVIALVGYSHGGGAVWQLADAMSRHAWPAAAPTLAFTGYVDAVQNSNSFNPFTESRRPAGAARHANYYQTNRFDNSALIGAATAGSTSVDVNRDFSAFRDPISGLIIDHLSIDNHPDVIQDLTERLIAALVAGPVLPPPTSNRSLTRTVAAGSGSAIAIYRPDAATQPAFITPFAAAPGGIRTAVGDFNRDGVDDIVAATGPGIAARVRILDGRDQRELFAITPFGAAFTGGLYVAAGDLSGDGVVDLVITPDQGGGPRVRIFSGRDFAQLADFFGIADATFRGGARAAVGDLNGDGRADLVVSAGFGGGPRVAAFNGAALGPTGGPKLFGDFFAFEPGLRNGIHVAIGDFNGDGRGELVAGAGPGGGPRVSVFDGAELLAGRPTRLADFFVGNTTRRGGVRVTVKNLDDDALADLVIGSGDSPAITHYTGSAVLANSGNPIHFRDLVLPAVSGGVYVG